MRCFVISFWGAIVFSFQAFALSPVSDSLSVLLEGSMERDTNRMMLLYQLASEKKACDTKLAENLAKEGYEIACELRDKRGIVEGLRQLAGLNYRKANYEEAEKQYKKAIEDASREKMTWEIARLKYDLGILYSRTRKYTEALGLFEEALPVFRQYTDRNNQVKCLFNLGKIAVAENDQKKAMTYYMEALRLAEEWQLEKEKALIYSNVGAMYFSVGELEKATEYFAKAQPVYKQLNDRGLLAGSYQQTGTAYILLKRYSEAKEFLIKSGDLFRDLGYKSQLSHVLNSLGVLAKNQKKYGEALLHYKEIYDYAVEARDTLWQVTALINLGSLYISLQNYKKATDVTRKALELGDAETYGDKYESIYENMALIYSQQQKYKEAYEWYRKYKKQCDKVFNQKKHRQIEELRTQYDVEKKEMVIRNLENENLLQRLTLQKTRIIQNTTGFGLLICLCFLFFFRRQYKKTVEANRNLVRKNQEIIYEQEKYLKELREVQVVKEKKGENTLSAEAISTMVNRINEIFLKEQIFKDGDLTLAALARKLNTNTSYLSRVINDYYGQNFSSFINRYRVNAAQKILVNPVYNHWTIEGIAKEVGFKSKSSFNIAFRTVTGLTPSAYKKAKDV